MPKFHLRKSPNEAKSNPKVGMKGGCSRRFELQGCTHRCVVLKKRKHADPDFRETPGTKVSKKGNPPLVNRLFRSASTLDFHGELSLPEVLSDQPSRVLTLKLAGNINGM